MKVYEVEKGATSLNELRLTERPDPQPGPRQVLIRVRATSLNYRDQMVVTGKYFGGPVTRNLIPLSDGAGEVAGVGPGVTRFKTGDRVIGTFFQSWISGPMTERHPALGSPLDGTLAEYIVLHEDGVVPKPNTISFEQAATLPCAAVTAWNALMVSGKPVKPGDTVLCLGTGGVSMAGLLFAKAAGARVIITSSSDDKIQRACTLGASDGINYKRHPEWQKEVMELTNGRGVDHILENGGAGSLNKSFESVAFAGKVALIGFLAGTGDINPAILMMKSGAMIGIGVGSRAMFEDMNRALEVNKIKPVVDKVFPFDKAADAYRCQASGDFIGKVVITV
ncbi:MAG TPA: NAD(P)-dependent alcohol dehydrogenase [Bryobacteraceae bacterium]|jgi:NADPH:quinone reductase-like Zn-dependent oxidoreductase|nr:NAD(P)-dependent alcohol dehydrogenase [Bryobacteraceae bacterium]